MYLILISSCLLQVIKPLSANDVNSRAMTTFALATTVAPRTGKIIKIRLVFYRGINFVFTLSQSSEIVLQG